MKHKKTLLVATLIHLSLVTAFAFAPKEISSYFNGPTVSLVKETSATFSLSKEVLSRMTEEEKASVYFEYSEPEKMCIAIYPTPEHCLPKKTEKGVHSVTVHTLTPNTKYRVVYKSDNAIRCITTPCPGNDFESLSVTFTTSNQTEGVLPHSNVRFTKDVIIKNLGFRSSGEEVKIIQLLLIQRGFMKGEVTGYFGVLTFKAIKDFQKSVGITPTGFVGPLTKKALNDIFSKEGVPEVKKGERFSGKLNSVSTGCFADGECNVVVSGKKVITTMGWRQAPALGALKGVPSLGDAEKCIGKTVNVFAKKVEDGYTLYGSTDYYAEIVDCAVAAQ